MRFVRGAVLVLVGAIFAIPLAALLLFAFPARDPGSEVAGLRMLALYLLGYLLCLAIGVLLSKKLFDVVWKTGSDRD